MNGCVYCTKDNECDLWTDDKHKSFCDPDCKDKHPSNADRIRAMSDEELADLLSCSMCSLCVLHYYCKENRNNRNCDDVILEWLKQEAET